MKKILFFITIFSCIPLAMHSASASSTPSKKPSAQQRKIQKFSPTPNMQALKKENDTLRSTYRQLRADLIREISRIRNIQARTDMESAMKKFEDTAEVRLRGIKAANEQERLTKENKVFEGLNSDILDSLHDVLEMHQVQEGRITPAESGAMEEYDSGSESDTEDDKENIEPL